MRMDLLDASLDLFARSQHYKMHMQPLLEPHGYLSQEYQRIFRWCVDFEMTCLSLAVAALTEGKAGYNPGQPRVLAGSPEGGRWRGDGTGSGRGGAGSKPAKPAQRPVSLNPLKPPKLSQPPRPAMTKPSFRLTPEELERFNLNAPPDTPAEDLKPDSLIGLPRWYIDGRVRPSMSPVDLIGIANVARNLTRVTVAEAVSIARIFRARFFGETAAEESIVKIRKAADTIEKFLGGKPDLVRFKNNGDMVLIKDDMSVRFDIVKYGSMKEARPHFQIQQRISPKGARKEKWQDLGQDWYDFQDSRQFIKE